MNIEKIYHDYHIMPNLALHQRRVAGVAQMLCGLLQPIDRDEIILACLLHDMGNIIKFKLELFPAFLAPQGKEYWASIQATFQKKYGMDEHKATLCIVEEIFSQYCPQTIDQKRTRELIDAIGFIHAKTNADGSDVSRKIAAYADMRVEPRGVVSLQDRLREGNMRYRQHKPHAHDDILFGEMSAYLQQIESQLCAKASISPDEITEEKVIAIKLPTLFK